MILFFNKHAVDRFIAHLLKIDVIYISKEGKEKIRYFTVLIQHVEKVIILSIYSQTLRKP